MTRLREIRTARGLKIRELADKIGVSEVSMSRYEREPSRLNVPLLRKLADALDSSVAAICGEVHPSGLVEDPPVYTYEPDLPPGYNGEIEPGHIDIGGTEFAAIARYDARLSAGPGAIVDPNAEPLGYHLVEAQWLATVTRAMPAHLCLLRVEGDSMRPTFDDGHWLLIDRSQTRINVPGVYALAIGDAAWVKRLSLNLADQLVRIMSDNPAYPEDQLPESDIHLIGRVLRIAWGGV